MVSLWKSIPLVFSLEHFDTGVIQGSEIVFISLGPEPVT